MVQEISWALCESLRTGTTGNMRDMLLNAPYDWAKPSHKGDELIEFVEFMEFIEFVELE